MFSASSNKITALAALICALFFLTVSGNAQRQRMSVDDRVKHLTEQLSLSDSQAVNVKVIYQAAEKQRDSIFQAHGDDRAGMRDEMKKAMNGVDLKIEALLTDAQKVTYEKIKKDRAQMMGAPPHEQTQKPDEKKPDKPKE